MALKHLKSFVSRNDKREYLQSVFSKQPKPIKYLTARILVTLGICNLFKIQKQDFKLHFSPTSLSTQLWITPEVKEIDEKFFSHYLKAGDKVIDIGANIGLLPVLSAIKVGDHGKVYSIEAHPQIYHYLVKNINLNRLKNVTSFKCAIGEESRTIVFSNAHNDETNYVVISPKEAQGIEVAMSSLDELLVDDGDINLLKVDVEGYEKFVFEGALKTLDRTNCVYFECFESNFEQFNYTSNDLIKILEKKGFRCFKLLDDLTLLELSNNYLARNCENLIAVKDLKELIDRTNYSLSSESVNHFN